MRLLDKYLLKRFTAAFFYAFVFFSVLFIVIDVFNNLDEFIQHHAPLQVAASYYFYLLGSVSAQLVPVALLVGLLYVLGDLNKHNEIIAMKASGISAFQILIPYLLGGLFLSLVLLWANETVIPQSSVTSTAIMEGLIKKGKENLKERAIQNVTFYTPDNRMIFAREYEVLTQTLHDVVILENHPDQTLGSKITAKKAEYRQNRWVFYGVLQVDLERNGEVIGQPHFSPERELPISFAPQDLIKEASRVEFMSAKELRDYIERLEGSGPKTVRRLWVEFHTKIALPFVCLIITLIGVPLGTRHKGGGTMAGIGTSFVIVAVYYGINSFCLALGKGGALPPFLSAWAGNLLFVGVGIYLIKNSS
ncbi:MAG: LptF/LptG family permease [Candidatus Omnitrophica bacterium]|nr:LptF/LptG family permease [Candidatus Omnitrophota bacterium]